MKPFTHIPAVLALLCAPLHSTRKPNVLAIMTDDMGFSEIACYGAEIPMTNLDKLAAGELNFPFQK